MARSVVATEDFSADLANWTQWNSAWGNCTITAGDQLQGPGGQPCGIYWTGAGTFTADQYSKIVVGGGGWYGSAYRTGCAVRMSGNGGTTRSCYFLRVEWDGSPNRTVRLGKVVNGTETSIATTSLAVVDGDVFWLEMVGSAFTCYRNTTEILAGNSDTDLASGVPGAVAQEPSAAWLDDVELGNITAAGGGAVKTKRRHRRLRARLALHRRRKAWAPPSISYSATLESGTYALTGQPIGLRADRRVTLEFGSYALTGQSASLAAARRLGLDSGTYSLTGQPVGLRRGFPLVAEAGSYALAGQAVSLLAARRVALEFGVYALTGNAIGLLKGFTATLAQGAYALTGQDIALRAARVVALASGTYALNGQSVALDYSSAAASLNAEQGSYALTGQPVGLAAARRLALESGVYSMSGQAQALLAARRITVESGAYTLNGQAIGLVVPARVLMETGSYVLTGMAVALTYSAAAAPAPAPVPLLGGGGGGSGRKRWANPTPVRYGEPTKRPTAAPTPKPTQDPHLAMLLREDEAIVGWVREMYARGDFEPRKP